MKPNKALHRTVLPPLRGVKPAGELGRYISIHIGAKLAARIPDIFFEALWQEIENDPDALSAFKGQNRRWGAAYFFSSIRTVVEVGGLQDEIELLIDRLGLWSRGPFFPIVSLEELIVGLKLYLINWSTIKDVMAMFINSVLDLGISEKDIGFGMILRNNKVQNTRIPEICKKHAKLLNLGYMDGARNDAVHRGKLRDAEVNELKNRRNVIQSKRFSLLVPEAEKMSDDEYKSEMNEFYKELSLMVSKKKDEYTKHYEGTVGLLKEIAVELAKIAARHLKDEKI
ncbi:MAG: hypothetical protein HUU08_12445 [Candidatus Brocadia sp.]|nr:hypothetical protein [Candidatus Brocadia sp.]